MGALSCVTSLKKIAGEGVNTRTALIPNMDPFGWPAHKNGEGQPP